MDSDIVSTVAVQGIGNGILHADIVAFETDEGREPCTKAVL
jgi:hypothetical protein